MKQMIAVTSEMADMATNDMQFDVIHLSMLLAAYFCELVVFI